MIEQSGCNYSFNVMNIRMRVLNGCYCILQGGAVLKTFLDNVLNAYPSVFNK